LGHQPANRGRTGIPAGRCKFAVDGNVVIRQGKGSIDKFKAKHKAIEKEQSLKEIEQDIKRLKKKK